MRIYITLLRGINVGGKNIIKMAELRKALEDISLCEVQTYIQSGNVLFKSEESEEVLCRKIEDKIQDTFGLSIAVVLRTAEELKQIVSNCPFSQEEIAQAESAGVGESLYVALLTHAPAEGKIGLLNSYRSEGEVFEIVGREVFLLFHNSIRNSKLANNLQKLDVPATVRNWKTINKLVQLAEHMGSDL